MLNTFRFRQLLSIAAITFLLGSIVGCSPKPSEQNGPNGQPATELYVLAAASLGDAMKELAPKYEFEHPGQKLIISYGASGSLQKQIEQGAPSDIFISAGTIQMEELFKKQLIDPQYKADLASNTLVLITPKASTTAIKSFDDLQNQSIKKIAVGQPESVPAGTYAKQALTSMGLWDSLQPKFVFAKDVRQVLTYVETGNVDAGIVYKTDAASSNKVQVAATADAQTHSPIVYPIGVTNKTKHKKEAQALFSWLQEAEADAVFEKYGFAAIGNR